MGMILQETGDIISSLEYFQKVHQIFSSINDGASNLLVAAMYYLPSTNYSHHAIGTNYALLGLYREALEHERKNFSILSTILSDPNDFRIQESNFHLDEYTTKAYQYEFQNRGNYAYKL